MHISAIGLDLAKSVFQVHGADAAGAPVLRRKLRRAQVLDFFRSLAPALVGIEACATAHHWAREIAALGHEVRLLPPQYVKAYVKRNKTDAADAEAICEAVLRPSMRFVPVKSPEQQAALMLHKSRDLLVRQRVMLTNAIRGHLAEFGIVAPPGEAPMARLLERVEDDPEIPDVARAALRVLVAGVRAAEAATAAVEEELLTWHRASVASQRLATIPGIGLVTATALAATVPDPDAFRSARDFAAWLGLVPRQHSTGGKTRLGGISKRGNPYLRRLLIVGASAMLRWAKPGVERPGTDGWAARLLARRPRLVTAVALAHKTARIAWAVMRSGENYRRPAATAAAA